MSDLSSSFGDFEHALEQMGPELFETLFSQSGVGKGLLNAQGQLLTVNKRLCKLLGCKRDELIGKSLLDWVHPEEQTLLKNRFQQLAHGPLEKYRSQKRLLHHEGQSLSVDMHLVCLTGIEAKTVCLLLEIQDLSHESLAKTAYRKQQSRLKQIEQLTRFCYSAMELPSEDIYWCDETYALFGLKRSQLPKQTFKSFLGDFVHPDDREWVEAVTRNCIRSRRPVTLRFRVLNFKGEVQLLQSHMECLYNSDSQSLRLLAYFLNLTPGQINPLDQEPEPTIETLEEAACNPQSSLEQAIESVFKRLQDLIRTSQASFALDFLACEKVSVETAVLEDLLSQLIFQALSGHRVSSDALVIRLFSQLEADKDCQLVYEVQPRQQPQKSEKLEPLAAWSGLIRF